MHAQTKMALSADVIQVLEEYNYVDWSVQVKDYLMAHDLWDIVEGTPKPPRKEDDESAFKAWSKKNCTALHVIQISCGTDAFSRIKKMSTAKIAWNTLAGLSLSLSNAHAQIFLIYNKIEICWRILIKNNSQG